MKGGGVTTLVLGAGASRGVSYAHQGKTPSPLDSDFFDLLQRSKPSNSKDQSSKEFALDNVHKLAPDYWYSMERAFYTLQLNAFLREKLLRETAEDEIVIAHFARSVQSLLRHAHGKHCCEHHADLLKQLGRHDAVISFNYDLVIERAIRSIAEAVAAPFGKWLYGFERHTHEVPVVLKLHGSSNWTLSKGAKEFGIRTRSWADFDDEFGYRGHSGDGTVFPIFLPFWDKKIEGRPWLGLWQRAAAQLSQTEMLVVWGYSLPPTDIKAHQLFRISIPGEGTNIKLCIIDPSNQTRRRWRELLSNAEYWEYERLRDFRKFPPPWWKVV